MSITSSEDLEKELNEFTLDLDDPSNSIIENNNIENNNIENNEIENLSLYEPQKDLDGLSI